MKLDKSLKRLIEKAKDIHGHLGPFLVLGIKLGLAGMKKLGIKGNSWHLRIEAELPRKVPYTCTLDGIQVTTQCTFGNQRLTLKEANSPMVSAKFSLNNPSRQTVISLKNEILQSLMAKLKEAKGESAQERLAWAIASMPEEELFSITFY
ncbi:hypothetical protein DRO54_05865 [Candidatus Bathyarchaeota archaeon]|nr:MAG: hypothetical protein DRO54_05865 [Candidatus Bathyarchaeota archaeon]